MKKQKKTKLRFEVEATGRKPLLRERPDLDEGRMEMLSRFGDFLVKHGVMHEDVHVAPAVFKWAADELGIPIRVLVEFALERPKVGEWLAETIHAAAERGRQQGIVPFEDLKVKGVLE